MFYVYIAYFNSKFSIGVTVDLYRRIKLLRYQKNKNYKIVHYEEYTNSKEAAQRENELQDFSTELIAELVLDNNPMMIDLLKKT